MRYWLMKSEPATFGIDDLERAAGQTTGWDGVRNYQARNMMRDQMKKGDGIFFYHSNCKSPGIVGIARVAREAYPDPTALDSSSAYFDPKSRPEDPRWYMVDVRLERRLKRIVTLEELRRHKALSQMPLLRRGNRLSITPVSAEQWAFILALE